MFYLAGRDLFDHAGIDLRVLDTPGEAIGVEEPRHRQQPCAFVRVGQRMVLDQVLEQDRSLLREIRVRRNAAERRERCMQCRLRQGDPRQRADGLAVSVEEIRGKIDVVVERRLPARSRAGPTRRGGRRSRGALR